MWNTRILCKKFEANKCSLTLMLSGSLSLSLCLVPPPPSHSLSHFLDPSIFLYFSMSLFPSTFISMTRSRVRALCTSLSLALACARLCTCVLSHSKAACRIWKNIDLGYRFVRQSTGNWYLDKSSKDKVEYVGTHSAKGVCGVAVPLNIAVGNAVLPPPSGTWCVAPLPAEEGQVRASGGAAFSGQATIDVECLCWNGKYSLWNEEQYTRENPECDLASTPGASIGRSIFASVAVFLLILSSCCIGYGLYRCSSKRRQSQLAVAQEMAAMHMRGRTGAPMLHHSSYAANHATFHDMSGNPLHPTSVPAIDNPSQRAQLVLGMMLQYSHGVLYMADPGGPAKNSSQHTLHWSRKNVARKSSERKKTEQEVLAEKASIEEGKGGGAQACTAGKDVVGAAPQIGSANVGHTEKEAESTLYAGPASASLGVAGDEADLDFGDESVCCLCMERESEISLHPCGHDFFCKECVVESVCRCNVLCPVCRTPFTAFTIHEPNNEPVDSLESRTESRTSVDAGSNTATSVAGAAATGAAAGVAIGATTSVENNFSGNSSVDTAFQPTATAAAGGGGGTPLLESPSSGNYVVRTELCYTSEALPPPLSMYASNSPQSVLLVAPEIAALPGLPPQVLGGARAPNGRALM